MVDNARWWDPARAQAGRRPLSLRRGRLKDLLIRGGDVAASLAATPVQLRWEALPSYLLVLYRSFKDSPRAGQRTEYSNVVHWFEASARTLIRQGERGRNPDLRKKSLDWQGKLSSKPATVLLRE